MTTIRAEVQHDHLERLATRPALSALAELIWNAVDGDATLVTVSIHGNGIGGIKAVTVADNGRGIAHDVALQAFKNVGMSWKKGRRSESGRALHGQKGEGRYTAFALGGHVVWSTRRKAEDAKVWSYDITGHSDDLRNFEVGDPNLVAGYQTGTEVEITNIQRVPRSLLAEDAALRLSEMFAVYLRQYPDVRIQLMDQFLDPASVQARPPADFILDDLTSDDGHPIVATLTIIEWKHMVERDLFLCDDSGCALASRKLGGIRAKGYQFTAYLKSQFLREKQSVLELDQLQPDLTRVLDKVKDQIRTHFRRRAAEDARGLVAQWKTENVYPYVGSPANPVEEVERQVFDVVALNVHEHLPSFAGASSQTKRFSFAMLKTALEESPNAVRRILQEVLDLPQAKREQLVELLDRTPLSKIISASRVIVDRLDFIEGLEVVLYHHEVKSKTKERKHLHRLLAENAWVFGEEFHIAVDDQGLTEVLCQHLKLLGRDPVAGLAPVTLVDGGHGIVDLMLAKKIPSPRGDEYEHLVVELKRPSQKLDKDVISQIKEYAFAVASDERFRTSKVRWAFWALSNDMNEFARREARQSNRSPGIIHQEGNITIWLKTWNEVLDECKGRLRFFREQLEYMATQESGVEHLRKVYTQYIPDVLGDDPATDGRMPIATTGGTMSDEPDGASEDDVSTVGLHSADGPKRGV